MQLRDYQTEILARTRHAFAKHRRVLLSLPVGAGKTVCASEMIRQASEKGRNPLFIVHRRELLLQAQNKLREFGCDDGIVHSIQKLVRSDNMPDADFIVVDEAHHAVADTYLRVLGAYPKAWILGLSATPCRLDGRGLGQAFDVIVMGQSAKQLIAKKVLLQPIVFAPSVPDLTGVHIRQGEYVTAELEEATATLIGDIVEHWKKDTRGRTVAFAVSIAHSEAIVAAFQAAGVRAEHIDGTHTVKQRDAILERLGTGETQVVSNCMLLGEGWDLPTLDTAILARPTASWALHVQQVGRVMRTAPGKDACVVLDHAGNHLRHGLVTDEVLYSLTSKLSRAQLRLPKRCKACFAVMDCYPCPECGWSPPPANRETTQDKDEELKELLADGKALWYRTKVRDASSRRIKLGWARWKFKERYGEWPDYPPIDDLYVCAGFQPHEKNPRRCARCLRLHQPRPVSGIAPCNGPQGAPAIPPPRVGNQGTNPPSSRFTF